MSDSSDLIVLVDTINRLNEVPDSRWWIGGETKEIGDPHRCCGCAIALMNGLGIKQNYGRISVYASRRGQSLGLASVNDGCNDRFQQATPKARTLAYLEWIKELPLKPVTDYA